MIFTTCTPFASEPWAEFLNAWYDWPSYPWNIGLQQLNIPSPMVHPHVRLVGCTTEEGVPASICAVYLPRSYMPSPWRHAWVSYVWTAIPFRNRGYATKVVNEAVRIAGAMGAEVAVLATQRAWAQDNLYARSGFTAVSNSRHLMFRKLLSGAPRPQAKLESSFEVFADDLSAISSIVARQHLTYYRGNLSYAVELDPEEFLGGIISEQHDLGQIRLLPTRLGSLAVCWSRLDAAGDIEHRLVFGASMDETLVTAIVDEAGIFPVARSLWIDNYLPAR